MSTLQETSIDRYCGAFARLRTSRAAIVLLAFFLITVLFVISPLSARLLQVPHSNYTVDFVFIGDLDSGQCYVRAAELSRSKSAEGVLIYTEEGKRLERLGAVPPIAQQAHRKLVSDGLDENRIHLIEGAARTDWDAARLLNRWMEQHPEKRVVVLCDGFLSQRWSIIVDRTLTASSRSRVIIDGVEDPRYSAANWWRTRTGLKSYFHGMCRLVYTRVAGEDRLPAIDWSAEKYEAAALARR